MDDDRAALAELMRASKAGSSHDFLHYLYFPTHGAACAAASELRQGGIRTQERLGADGVNWLVLARQDVVPTEHSIAATRQLMESLVRRHGGEYDGWEAEAIHRPASRRSS